MQYFTVSCSCRGKLFLDGEYQGMNKDGETLHVFSCEAGLHDVSLEYENGEKCRKITQRVIISGTSPYAPLQVHFLCEL